MEEPLPFPNELPAPNGIPEKSTPKTEKGIRAASLGEFASTFQARGGTHEVWLINPVTGAAARVRFSLPYGSPRRIVLDPQGVDFVYGRRHFVRIHFNSDGPVVTSR
jgi:hypothetical protein